MILLLYLSDGAEAKRPFMTTHPKNILITGLPGSGKTTFIRKLADDLRPYEPVGFFTQEIRERGIRKGFGMTSFGGLTGTLAQVDVGGPYRVGRYGVNVDGFELFLRSLPLLEPRTRIIIIDEIGKMECLSARFRATMTGLLDSATPVIATVAVRGSEYIGEVRRRPDIVLVELTVQNRDTLLPRVLERVRDLLGS
jgi:nucleoside-triphosphatase